jgi:hypothetical protein
MSPARAAIPLAFIHAFVGWGRHQHTAQQQPILTVTTTARTVVPYQTIADDFGYTVQVERPLGVVFGENTAPYYGLVVDDVEPERNGEAAGLAVGDQLLAVNGVVVIGRELDAVLPLLTTSTTNTLQLQLYRGTIKRVYVLLRELNAFDPADDDGNESNESDRIVMDESYESPVKVDVSAYQQQEEDPITVGDIFKVFQKVLVGGTTKPTGDDKKTTDDTPSATTPQTKKGMLATFFPPAGETIQLDGDDARSLK